METGTGDSVGPRDSGVCVNAYCRYVTDMSRVLSAHCLFDGMLAGWFEVQEMRREEDQKGKIFVKFCGWCNVASR